MSTRKEIVSGFYGQADEDSRLKRSRHGQLEYATTMAYIHRYAGAGSKVLEVGAGTGRYSIALAKEGMKVTAVELVESNLEVLRENSRGIGGIESYQGDATDLSRFADGNFDMTLVLGPMYHLYEQEEVHRAIDEAIRVAVALHCLLQVLYGSQHGILLLIESIFRISCRPAPGYRQGCSRSTRRDSGRRAEEPAMRLQRRHPHRIALAPSRSLKRACLRWA